MKKLILLILFNVMLAISGYSQSTRVGAYLGYGSGYFNDIAHFEYLFNDNSFNNFEFSGLVSHKPSKHSYSIQSGITYQILESPDQQYSFLKVPLGIEVEIGKQYQFLFGLGLYIQAFLNSTQKTYYEFSDYQAGFNLNFGTGYVLNDKYTLFIKFRKDNDITKLYTEESSSRVYREPQNIYSYKYSIAIGLNYRIIRRQKQGQ